MRVVLVNLLVVISLLPSESAIIGSSLELNQELFHYKNLIRIMTQQLAKECPEKVRAKREISDELIPTTELKVHKLYYNSLLRELSMCIKENQNIQTREATTSIVKTTTAPPRATSKLTMTTKPRTVSNKKSTITAKPTTTESIKTAITIKLATTNQTVQPPPAECLSASNITDSWRIDHDGKNLRGSGPDAHPEEYACDFRKSLQWFRFTGAAGKNDKS